MKRRIVDAHHHLWDLDACCYPWLIEKGVKRFFGDPAAIQKNYLVDDLRSDASAYELEASVHIQVGVVAGDEVRETAWLEETAGRDGLPTAIVAYCDLESPQVERTIDAHRHHSRLRGVRQIVGRSAEEDAKTGSGALLDNPAWRDGLALLNEHGLTFDLQLIPPQLPRAAEVMASVDGLGVALCHCGSPWDRSPSGLRDWRRGLELLAENDRVHCKISGLAMFDHDWEIDDIRPLIETCIDVFGPARCMFGSNFPVDKLHKQYGEIWKAYERIAGELPQADQDRLFGATARAFYRLD